MDLDRSGFFSLNFCHEFFNTGQVARYTGELCADESGTFRLEPTYSGSPNLPFPNLVDVDRDSEDSGSLNNTN